MRRRARAAQRQDVGTNLLNDVALVVVFNFGGHGVALGSRCDGEAPRNFTEGTEGLASVPEKSWKEEVGRQGFREKG